MSSLVERLRGAVDDSEHWSDDYHQSPELWAVAREAADYLERIMNLIPELIELAQDHLQMVENEWGQGWRFETLVQRGDHEAVLIQSVIDAVEGWT